MGKDEVEKINEAVTPIEENPTKAENPEVPGLDLKEIMNNPLAAQLLGGLKDVFKKEKADPNICEITIKAPSEVILKLFKVE